MATFTITTPVNYESLTGGSAIATLDVYNINGGKLTIDTDTRYCLNHSTAQGSLDTVNISATLGGEVHVDGTKVRLIPFNSGTGTVPAIGATISQGGVTATVLTVMSAVNVSPTAPAATMPTSGFIKVKNKTGGNFTSGALTGIGANATGADTVGWIEVIGSETATMTVPRLGTFRVTGEWYNVGTTSGVANQQIQLPGWNAVIIHPGVYVETGVGTGQYELYPCAGSQTTVATDVRAKVCWISGTGLLRIGHNGTANAGYTPPAGLKIVLPNILFINTTRSASGAINNSAPNSTLATRYDFTTTGGGVIEIDKCHSAWYWSFSQAYSVNISNSGTFEQILVSEIAAPMTWTNVGVGQSAAQSQFALLMSLCFAGGTFTNCHWTRATLAASGQYTTSITDVNGFTFTNTKHTALTLKANATTGNALITRAVDCIWESPDLINGRMVFVTCTNVSVIGTAYCDVITATTTTTAVQNSYVFEISSNCSGMVFSGLDFFGLTNVQPYLGVLNVAAAGCANIKLRNIGNRTTPLSLGATNGGAYLFVLSTGAAANNVKVQRCFVSSTRTGLWTGDNSSTNIFIENTAGDYADAPVLPMLNAIAKGIGCTTALTAQTACYGTHFIDYFTSATVGRIGVLMNEKTSTPLSASSYNVLSGTPIFTSAGGLFMPTIGQSIEFEMPYFALGHTAFANSAAVMAGGTIGNYTLQYQLDKNNGSGYGTLKTLSGANLSAETGIDASLGVKLKIRITTSVTNATAITSLYVITATTTVAQGYNYPLDTYNLTLTNIISGSDVVILQAGTETVLNQVDQNVTSNWVHTYETPTMIDIFVSKAGYVPFYIRNYNLQSSNASLPIAQTIDRNFIN
jgi:hypothetical protein